MLSSWGIAFVAIDTEAQPAAMQELARLGIPRVPAVVAGERAVHGWNPKALAELLGVAYAEGERLPPEELGRRLDRILEAAAPQALRQVPPQHLAVKTPGRDRTLRDLGYHIFRVALSYRDAKEQGYLPEAWFEERPPAPSTAGRRWPLTAKGCAGSWRHGWGSLTPLPARSTLTTAARWPADLLERTVWHAAQHLRQLYALLDAAGITSSLPLPADAFAGLPLPQAVW
ncbi:MAG: hypothetical protein KatS3mg131_2615 [Candidatus Tectimicrobiota bacterium]|nr:MAG: hypothetical protein KatS3mg131_2615 [Candidatus Tectomicrobia bacterium]